jgi:hypothetical protein
LGGVTNLDVSSGIVLTASENVALTTMGTYTITITNLANGATKNGFQTETTDHTQIITIVDGVVTSGGSITINGDVIVINPTFDLDISNNYSLAISDGAFTGAVSSTSNTGFTPVNFSTVTPGDLNVGGASAAVDSVYMSTVDGTLQTGQKWLDVTNPADDNPGMNQFSFLDASVADYTFVIKDFDPASTGNGELLFDSAYLQFQNFGANDLLYIDDQYWVATAQDDVLAFAFGYGLGTDAQPFGFNALPSTSIDGTTFHFEIDPAVTLPGDVGFDPTLNNVLSNGWSNTGMIIAA